MLRAIIDFSLKNRFLVLLATAALVLGGVWALRTMPLDAIPDLSDTQVIVYTEWAGQAPKLVEGRADNLKITRPEDLEWLRQRWAHKH